MPQPLGKLTTSNQKLSKHDARCFLSRLISHRPPFLFLKKKFLILDDRSSPPGQPTFHPPTWVWLPPWRANSRSPRRVCWPARCGCREPRSPRPEGGNLVRQAELLALSSLPCWMWWSPSGSPPTVWSCHFWRTIMSRHSVPKLIFNCLLSLYN